MKPRLTAQEHEAVQKAIIDLDTHGSWWTCWLLDGNQYRSVGTRALRKKWEKFWSVPSDGGRWLFPGGGTFRNDDAETRALMLFTFLELSKMSGSDNGKETT